MTTQKVPIIRAAAINPPIGPKSFTNLGQLISTVKVTAKAPKKEVTEISLDAVNQVNENIDLTELMTAKREYTLSKEQIKAAINALPIQKTPGVGMVFIAQFLDKSNNRGTYEVVFFNTETKEIIEEWITDGKARGFGLRNYWAGSIYSALKKL